MKSLISLVMIMSSFSALAINIGDQVMETKGINTLQEVMSIASNDKIFLSDGNAYKPKQVHSLVKELKEIKVGMSVLEELYNDNIKMVKAISENGLYMLEDDKTYQRSQIHHLLTTKLNDFEVGMEILEDKGDASLQTIIAIAENGKIILSDENIYNKKNVHTLQENLYGIIVGDEVREHYQEKNLLSFNKSVNLLGVVVAIANNKFFLDSGNFHKASNVYPLQDEFYGIKVGSCVVETQRLHSVRIVEAISGTLFLLDDGHWYKESKIDRNPTKEKCDKLKAKIEAKLLEEAPAI